MGRTLMSEASAPVWTLVRVLPGAEPAAMVGAWLLADVQGIRLLTVGADFLVFAGSDAGRPPAARIEKVLEQDRFAGWVLRTGLEGTAGP
jgi:hypothetical protein